VSSGLGSSFFLFLYDRFGNYDGKAKLWLHDQIVASLLGVSSWRVSLWIGRGITLVLGLADVGTEAPDDCYVPKWLLQKVMRSWPYELLCRVVAIMGWVGTPRH
jgi:hypothetical protein